MLQHENIIYNISDISEISKRLLKECLYNVVCLKGELGTGKTTITKAFLKEINAIQTGNSPTFGIVNEYSDDKGTVVAYHIDCYRLEGEEEALDIGIEEYLGSEAWVFIEWPEQIASLLPVQRTEIRLEVINETTRRLYLQNLPAPD